MAASGRPDYPIDLDETDETDGRNEANSAVGRSRHAPDNLDVSVVPDCKRVRLRDPGQNRTLHPTRDQHSLPPPPPPAIDGSPASQALSHNARHQHKSQAQPIGLVKRPWSRMDTSSSSPRPKKARRVDPASSEKPRAALTLPTPLRQRPDRPDRGAVDTHNPSAGDIASPPASRTPQNLPRSAVSEKVIPIVTPSDASAQVASSIDSLKKIHRRSVQVLLGRARVAYEHMQLGKHEGRLEQINNRLCRRHATNPFTGMKPISRGAPEGSPDIPKLKMLGQVYDTRKRKVYPATIASLVPCVTWPKEAFEMPEYVHYVTVSSNTLARNVKQLDLAPYFGDELSQQPEEHSKLVDRLRTVFHWDIQHRAIKLWWFQRACHYRPAALALLAALGLSEAIILWYLLAPAVELSRAQDLARQSSCDEDFDCHTDDWRAVFRRLDRPGAAIIDIAAATCVRFRASASFSLWHIVRRSHHAGKATVQHDDMLCESTDAEGFLLQKLACRICHEHDCASHGIYEENPHERTSPDPKRSRDETPAEEAADEQSFATDSYASPTPLQTSDVLLDVDRPPDCNYRRYVSVPAAPLAQAEQVTRPEQDRDKSYARLFADVRSRTLWDEPQFMPCHHPGLSCDDREAHCTCAMGRRFCEIACGCAPDCPRRYRGCRCRHRTRKPGKCCVSSCECAQLHRECTADLCGTCGARELLDPSRRDADAAWSIRRCRNVGMQLGRPMRTLLGSSTVHGFGLFAGEAIRAGDFVCEYKGELITNDENERRSVAYELRRMSFFFHLSSDMDLDSYQAGNKARFINCASGDACNITADVRLCNMQLRVAFYAKEDIRAGAEMFFDYGPQYPHDMLGEEVITDGGGTAGVGLEPRRRQGPSPEASDSEYDQSDHQSLPDSDTSAEVGPPHRSGSVSGLRRRPGPATGTNETLATLTGSWTRRPRPTKGGARGVRKSAGVDKSHVIVRSGGRDR